MYQPQHAARNGNRKWRWALIPVLALGLNSKTNTGEFEAVTVADLTDSTWPPREIRLERPFRRIVVDRVRPKIIPPKKARKKVEQNREPVKSTSKSQRVLAAARSLLGIPYSLGGSDSDGIDCSGFTMRAYAVVGKKLPHASWLQPLYGTKVSNPQPGDLVKWPYKHVAIYLGNGKVIGARKSGTVSQIYDLYDTPVFYRMV